MGALCWQTPQGDRKVVPALHPQVCETQMKTAAKVEGTNTHTDVRSAFLTVCKFNYSVDHALPEHLQPLADTNEPSPKGGGTKMDGFVKATSRTRVLLSALRAVIDC